MKPHQIIAMAIASLAIASTHVKADVSYLLQHNVAFQFSLKYEGDVNYSETRNGFRESSRFVTERISNKQILEGFVEEGLIDTIRGWSIVMITDQSYIYGFALTKRGEDLILLGCDFSFDTSCEEFHEFSRRVDVTRDPADVNDHTRAGIGRFTMRVGDFATMESQGDYSIRISSEGDYGNSKIPASEEIESEKISYYGYQTITGLSFDNMTSVAYYNYYYDVTIDDTVEMQGMPYYYPFGIMTGRFMARSGVPLQNMYLPR